MQFRIIRSINILISKIKMFSFKRRTKTFKKIQKTQTIHSFCQDRAYLTNALSLTLRKSCNQPRLSLEKVTQRASSFQQLQTFAICYPSLFKSRKINPQKLLQNRRVLNERGKKINDKMKTNNMKMVSLQQYKSIQENENNPYLWRANLIELAKNKAKLTKQAQNDKKCSNTVITCQGQACQSNYEDPMRPLRKVLIQKIRKSSQLRMTEPFDKGKRISTMPEFQQEGDMNLSPWQATD